MADPDAALATQLRNIETRTGQTLEAFRTVLAASGLAKHGEQRALLMERFALGYGDANTVVHLAKRSAAAAPEDDDPLAAIYTGPKAHLRPLHEQLIGAIDGLGAYEKAPKKAYVSLRRKKQFAMLGPATKDSLELGLNAKQLPQHSRLKAQPAGSMCQFTLRFSSPGEIDAELLGWVRAAYDAAG